METKICEILMIVAYWFFWKKKARAETKNAHYIILRFTTEWLT